MALTTNQHAEDVNTLLRYLGITPAHADGQGPVSASTAREAAVRLANAASAKLMAGLSPHDVTRCWQPGAPPPAITAAPRLAELERIDQAARAYRRAMFLTPERTTIEATRKALWACLGPDGDLGQDQGRTPQALGTIGED